MEFRCTYDPELSAEKGRNGGKPRYEKPRGGRSLDPRQRSASSSSSSSSTNSSNPRGKRAGFGSHGPAPLPWARTKPQKKLVPISKRLLVTGFDVLATRTDAFTALAGAGAIEECVLVTNFNTGASLGACRVVFETEAAAKTCLGMATKQLLRIGMLNPDAIAVVQDPSGAKESEVVDRAKTVYAKEQEKQAQIKLREAKRAAKAAAKAAAPQLTMQVMTPSQRYAWLLENVGENATYIYVAAHWVPVQRVRCDELERFVGMFNPTRIVANRQGFYIVFDVLKDACECYNTLNGQSLRGFDVHMKLCGPATQNLKTAAPENTKQNVVKQITLEMVEALRKDIRQRVVYPYVREYLVELAKNRPVAPAPDTNDNNGKPQQTFATGEIRFRKKSHAIEPVESTPKRQKLAVKQAIDSDESEPETHVEPVPKKELVAEPEAPVETKPISPEESNDQLPELSDEDVDDEVSEEEMEAEEVSSVMGWAPEPGHLPIPVQPAPEDRYLTTFLGSIVDEEDLAFAKAAVKAPPKATRLLTEEEIAAEIQRMSSREELHRKVQSDGLVVDWKVPPAPSWRTYGYRSYPIEAKRMWVPEHRHKEAIDVIERSGEAEVSISSTDAFTGTVQASGTIDQQTAERERREKRGQSRRMAKALSYNKSVYGMNTDLFLENQLNKSTKRVRLARSAIHDWGLYAGEPIAPQDFVIEYIGEALREEFGDIREREYISEGIDSSYLFRIDSDVIVDATKKGNLARFINHSCQPNCVAKIITLDKRKRIALYATRDIEPGEELTFDYKFAAEEGEDRVVCFCGAEKCRGFLV